MERQQHRTFADRVRPQQKLPQQHDEKAVLIAGIISIAVGAYMLFGKFQRLQGQLQRCREHQQGRG